MLKRRGGFGKKRNTGKTVSIQGPISRVYRPEQLDNFNGYAIVVIGGNVVKGQLPFIDMNFSYNLHCYLVNSPRGPEHEISAMGDPPYTPLPLTRERFKIMLHDQLNMPEYMSSEVLASMKRDPRLTDLDFNNMDPQKLLTSLTPTPDWLDRLAKESLYFRYPFVKILHRFWDPADLAGFGIQQLLKIASEFDTHPESFAYSWLNNYGLPELSYDKIQLAFRLQNKPDPRNLYQRIVLYERCKVKVFRGRPCITAEDLDEWRLQVEPAVGAKLIQPAGSVNRANFNPMERFYFIVPQWNHLQTVVNGLRRLNAKALSQSLFLARPRKLGLAYAQLNAKQQFLVDSSRRYGFMIWNAGAGTGKTTTALSSSALSSRRMVMPVAYFGRVASNLLKSWNQGITIHRLYNLVKNETEQGETYKKQVRRVFIDEGSHLTMELFAMVFESCPLLEQIIFMGDQDQMRPPSGVPIYESLIRFYQDTPIVQSLDEVMRVDRSNAESAQILIDNGRKIRENNSDLVFSRELVAENPFVVIPRMEIPGEHYVIGANTPEVRQKRVDIIKKTMEPVLAYFRNFQDFQMLTLRHDTIADMNMALTQLMEGRSSNGFHQERVYNVGSKIMFSENYYPPRPIRLPKDPEARRRTFISFEWRSRTTQVNNNEICIIDSIVDMDPNSTTEIRVENTSKPRSMVGFHRVLRLSTGGQVNLSIVPLSKIYHGDVSTASSSQGGEWGRIFLYLDPRDCKVDYGKSGSLMKSDTLYTIVTRAKQQVIIACRAPYDDLSESDIGVVISSTRSPPDLILHGWLPHYEGQILQSSDAQNPDPDRTDVSEDGDDGSAGYEEAD